MCYTFTQDNEGIRTIKMRKDLCFMAAQNSVAPLLAIGALVTIWTAVAGASLEGLSPKAYDNPNGNTRVVCFDDPTQSYELYIPPTAPTQSPSPILYCFDPGGNGKSVLLSLASMALEQGWIIAASNNSRNGPWADIFVAQDAVMRDTEHRLNLHPTRRFATGFSGGARASLALAFRYPEKLCGVLCLGAGWPSNTWLEPSDDRLVVYMIIGTSDSNNEYDIPRTEGILGDYGIRCTVQEWNAGHTFPPQHMLATACRWLETHAEIDPNAGLPTPTCPPIALHCQPPPSPYAPWISFISDTGWDCQIYENFDGMSKPIARVDWWGISCLWHETSGYWLSREPAGNQFRISFFEDAGGTFGALVHQETLVAQREDMPQLFSRNFPLRHYTAQLSSSVPLNAGWVRIEQIRSTTAPSILWMNSYNGDGFALHWIGEYEDYYWLDQDMALALSPVEVKVGFTASNNRGKPPLTVEFKGSISGNADAVESWHWDFGDGQTQDGLESILTHEYEEEGVYTVTLTVTAGEDVVVATKHNLILVSNNLPASAPWSLLALCLMLAVAQLRYMIHPRKDRS